MSLAMTEHERQEFLAGVHIGAIPLERTDGPPLTVPIWYGYEPGGLVWTITGAESLKGRLLNAAGRSQPLRADARRRPFYKYVSVEGPIRRRRTGRARSRPTPVGAPLPRPELGDAYLAGTDEEARLKFSMRPDSLVVGRLHEVS